MPVTEHSNHYSELAGVGLAVFAMLALLFAAASPPLAIFTARGAHPARVMLFLLGGLAVCVQSGLSSAGSSRPCRGSGRR